MQLITKLSLERDKKCLFFSAINEVIVSVASRLILVVYKLEYLSISNRYSLMMRMGVKFNFHSFMMEQLKVVVFLRI